MTGWMNASRLIKGPEAKMQIGLKLNNKMGKLLHLLPNLAVLLVTVLRFQTGGKYT